MTYMSFYLMLFKLFLSSLVLVNEPLPNFSHRVLLGVGQLLAAACATKLLCCAWR